MKSRLGVAFLLVVGLMGLVVGLGAGREVAAQGGSGTTTVISSNSEGELGNNHSLGSSLSADNRFVTFSSSASNLVPNDTNDQQDVFIRDLQTGVITRVSVGPNGLQSNGSSYGGMSSADGRFVVFTSGATNLVPSDTNGVTDAFIHDRQTGTTIRYSVASSGAQGNGHSSSGAISADNRYITFNSRADNLVTNDTNDVYDVFVRDLELGTTRRISVSSAGVEGNGDSHEGSISADGRYVLFDSSADNLVPGDTLGWVDTFVHDLQTRTTTLVSVSSSGEQVNSHSSAGGITSDGRFVAFSTNASNLHPGDTPSSRDVFIHDRLTGKTTCASEREPMTLGDEQTSDRPSLSSDGRFVAFESTAYDLVPGVDSNSASDVFVYDRLLDSTIRVSVNSYGVGGNNYSEWPIISSDGRRVVFSSDADNLVPGDTNHVGDVFIHELPPLYAISGTVTSDANNAPIAGVLISSGPHTATTDAGGTYRLSGLSAGDHVLVASKPGLDFQPASRLVSVAMDTAGVNFLGSTEWSITGRVTDIETGEPLIGVLISDGEQTTETDNQGNYSLDYAGPGEWVIVATKDNWGATPAAQTISGPPTAAGVNFRSRFQPWMSWTQRVSVNSGGGQANDSSQQKITISADGRYVAFSSEASNLVAGDTNNKEDIFVYDRQYGMTTRVSVSSDGAQANNDSMGPTISADGRYVAFYSLANDLVIGDMNREGDIFLHDRLLGVTTRVSIRPSGIQGNEDSYDPTLTADARFVIFTSNASNLVDGDTNGLSDVFIIDLVNGSLTLLSVTPSGLPGNGASFAKDLSADGRFVVFSSTASNLAPCDTTDAYDVFVRDRQTGNTTCVSVGPDGMTQGNTNSEDAAISANGRFVTFASSRSDLVVGDTNGEYDIFVRDLEAGTTSRVSVSSAGAQANSGSFQPDISDDGRYVAFQSRAYNLVSGNNNWGPDVLIHDRYTGVTSRVSVDSNSVQGMQESREPSLSANGRLIAFTSGSSNLVPGDTNGQSDVFVHERPTFSVAGTVVSSPGNLALPGIVVSTGYYSATTDNQGDYSLTGLPAGLYTLTTSAQDGYAFVPPTISLEIKKDESGIDFTGLVLWLASGQVTNSITGEPVIGATVSNGVDSTQTNGQGGFEFDGLLPGEYVFTASKEGWLFTPAAITCGGPPNATDIAFMAVPQPWTATGRVLDQSTGQPIAEVTVSGGENATQTDSQGYYTLANLEPGERVIIPTLPYYTFSPASQTLIGPPNQTGVNFQAQAQPWPASGRVTHGATGEPIAGALVASENLSAFTDEQGYYTLAGLEPGARTVTVSKAGWTFDPPSAERTGPPAATGVDFTGWPTWSAAGRVVDSATGHAVANVTIASGQLSTTTGSDGTYTLAGLPYGERIITAAKEGWTFSPTSLTLSGPPNVSDADFQATFPGWSLAGRVTDRDTGDGVAGVTISTGDHSATTDGDGTYQIAGLPSGFYTVVPSKPGLAFTPASRNVSVLADVTDVDFSSTSSTAAYSLSGHLYHAVSGLPVAGAAILAGNNAAVSDANGDYTLTGLAPGVYVVAAAKPGLTFAPASRSVTLPPDATGVDFGGTSAGAFLDSTTRVSVATDGTAANAAADLIGGISADGRFVLFGSQATNLAPGDTQMCGTINCSDVFLRDTRDGQTTRLSVAPDGTQADGDSYGSDLSADGRFVVFVSYAGNLIPGDSNGVRDVFLLDRQTGALSRVSVADNETEGNNDASSGVVSDDGRYVAFTSRASNLVPGDAGTDWDAFLRDTQSGTTTRLSLGLGGAEPDGGASVSDMSGDARFVVLNGDADNLVPGDTNSEYDVFILDRQSGEVTRVSVTSDGAQANGESLAYPGAISADGRYIAFGSSAGNLAPGVVNGQTVRGAVYVHDRQTGTTELAVLASDGTPPSAMSDADGFPVSLSADGRFVAFMASAPNLVYGDTNDTYDIFVRDRLNGTTTRVSVATDGTEAWAWASRPHIASDGCSVVFPSDSDLLAPGDANNDFDIYKRTLLSLCDKDLEGVTEAVEAGAPNSGDGNNDGVPDSQQANVASLPNSGNGEYVTLAAPPNADLTDVAAPDNPAPGTEPEGTEFPLGFLRFNIAGLTPGAAVTVEVIPAAGFSADTYYKYGPTPDNAADHWYEFLYDGATGAEMLPDKIVLHFVDGGRGDGDRTANGGIADPGAPARQARQTMTLNPSADAYTNSGSPSANFGQVTTLRVRDGSPTHYTFLRFDDPGLSCATILSARLRLFVSDAAPSGGEVYTVAGGWTETGITWKNDPTISGAPLDTAGAAVLGEWVEFDVAAALAAAGPFHFGIKGAGTNPVYYASRETDKPPQLVIEYRPMGSVRPDADFSATPLAGFAPLTVAFSDASSSCPSTWAWAFGDGGAGTAQNPSHTYTAPGVYTVSLTVTNANGSDTATRAGAITVESAPAGPGIFYVSPSGAATIGGFAATGADILRYTRATNTWAMVYDGSVRGTPKNVGAFDLLPDGRLLLVFSANQAVRVGSGAGATTVTATPRDVVAYDPATGIYEMYIVGKNVGLTTKTEVIDALDTSGDRVLISTAGAVAVGPNGTIKAADEDVLALNRATGIWETALVIDGSLLPGMAAEDINGLWADPATGDIYVTILGAFNLGGLAGNDKSIVKLSPNGGTTVYTPSLVTWLATGATFAGKLDGLELAR